MVNIKDKRWLYRRRVIYGILLYCLVMIIHLMINGQGDSRLQQDIAGSLILLASVTFGGFVFGLVMDSENTESAVNHDTVLGSWHERRNAIFVALGISAYIVGYMIFKGDDTELNSTIANGFILFAGTVSSSYIFGAVWDDRNLRQRYGQRQPSFKRDDDYPDDRPSRKW
jgi:hypothetical protein